MRILVAGGAGYVGSVLVPKLIELGHEVTVLDLMWFGNHLPAAAIVREGDILNLTEQDLIPFDQVVFLAGLSNDPMADYSPSKNFVSNAASPALLAYLSKRAGVRRFVYASSCSVYGFTKNELYDETAPTVSNYPYGISKLQGEFAAMQLHDDRFSVIALRKGTISGYSPRMRLDLVVNTMFKSALIDGVIRVNNPEIWRPILAMEDAISAYVTAIEAPLSLSGIFNVASDNFTLIQIGEAVQQGVEEFLNVRARLEVLDHQDVRNYRVSLEKARRVLRFVPKCNIRDIVRELAQRKADFADLQNPRYYNIATFKNIDAAAVAV